MKSCAWVRVAGAFLALVVMFESSAAEPKAAGAAAKSSEKLPSAEEILKRHAKEIGGKAAFEKVKSQHAKGSIEIPGQQIKGNMEVYAQRPNKLLVKMTMPGVGDVTTAFDGTNGWMETAVTGPMLLPDSMLKQLSVQADFDQALHDPEDYSKKEVVGKEQFEGEECYKLNLVHKNGFASTEFFSVKTGLQKGFIATQESPFGAVQATSIVTDYKKFGDLYMPSKTTQKVSGVETVMTIQEITYDEVDPSVFNPPPAVKALLEKKQSQP